MTVLRLIMKFHGPFSISTGLASGGIDATVDRQVPIAASGLKGLMRSQAEHVLQVNEKIIWEIFGDKKNPCPWGWNDAVIEAPSTDGVDAASQGSVPNQWKPQQYARIRVDESGQAANRALRIGEHIWASRATYEIEQILPLAGDRRALHLVVLRAAARSVSSMGGGRRRGEGWVSIADEEPWTAADTQTLLAIKKDGAK